MIAEMHPGNVMTVAIACGLVGIVMVVIVWGLTVTSKGYEPYTRRQAKVDIEKARLDCDVRVAEAEARRDIAVAEAEAKKYTAMGLQADIKSDTV